MAADVVVEEVFPSVEELTNVATGIECHVQGCSKVFNNSSSLRMHVIKTHNIATNDEEKRLFTRSIPSKKPTKKIFYCPVDDCWRNKKSKKPFPRLSQVKQHYMTVHAEKKYVCTICGHKFGIQAACKRHEEKCGQTFNCSCGCPFTTIEALYMHAKRKNHELPGKCQEIQTKPQELERRNKNQQFTPTPQPKTTVIIISNAPPSQSTKTPMNASKYPNILPKPAKCAKCNTITNTTAKQPTIKKDAHTQTKTGQSATKVHSTTQTATQAMSIIPGNLVGALTSSSVGIQVQGDPTVSTMMDFNSLVMLSKVCEQAPQSSSVGTQHDGPVYMETLDSSTCYNSQNFTLPNPPYFNTSQTQTSDFTNVSFEDNAAQTLISILDMDACSADCATQTQVNVLDDILNGTDVELTESQTQTWFSSLMPHDALIDDNVFGNRTALDVLVNTETQTAINDIAFDVGLINSETQTIPEPFG